MTMATMMTSSIPLAFLAGLASFLSPCVLPLVPSYLAYIGGSSATVAVAQRRRLTLRNSVLFVLGFALIFMSLGASASALGGVLSRYRGVLIPAGGVLVVGFGLIMLGVFRLPLFYRDTRRPFRGDSSTPVGAVLLGMAFAGGWTPCIGPVLGSILTLAGAGGTLRQGVALLGVYALGLGVPFLLAAVALGSFGRFSRGFGRYLLWVERVSGGVLLIAGVLMLTGEYTRLNTMLIQYTPGWLWNLL